MKKLIALLLLVCSAAHAERWLETPNNAGGKLMLLEIMCAGENAGRVAISTTNKGETIRGCWFLYADMVHVQWSDESLSSYDPELFVVRDANETQKPKKNNRKQM